MKYLLTIFIILNVNPVLAIENDIICRLSSSYIAPNVQGEDVPKKAEVIYYLSKPDNVTIYIKGEKGAINVLLKDTYKESGMHKVLWNGKDNKGNIVKKGEYTVAINTKSGFKKELKIKVVNLIAKISLPIKNSLVKADVPIWGLACGMDFKEFKLEYGMGINPNDLILINRQETPVTRDVHKEDLAPDKQPLRGNLGTWETGLRNYYYKDYNVDLKGVYTIKLTVVDKNGNTVEDRKTVEVGDVVTNVFGGIVESTDGKVKLNFTEHSLYESFLVIGITPKEDAVINLPYRVISNIYEIRPGGIGFVKPCLLETQYDLKDNKELDENNLGIYIYNDDNNWTYLETFLDSKNKKLIAKIDYFPRPKTFCIILHNPLNKNLPHKEMKGEKRESGSWKAWKGTLLEKEDNAYKITNEEWGGYFGVDVNINEADIKKYPVLEFDYKVPIELKINILIKVGGRWYDIVFTDDPKQYLRINTKKIGIIEKVQKDDEWHHAKFDILEGLKKYTKETIIEEIVFADFDSNGYVELNPGLNTKGITYHISNFCLKEKETISKGEISYTSWQIGEDDGNNGELAYEKYEGQFKDSDTDDDFYIGDPQGEFERAVAFDDQIVNIIFPLNENEIKDKYLFYIDVMDCDLREHDYIKFAVYINDKLIDNYTCYLKKGRLYAVPAENLINGRNKIAIKWLSGGNWVTWDYVAFRPIRLKEEIKISIKGDKIYVNGEQFIVKGIGYAPCRPGDFPWGKRPSRKTLENDFKLIKEAGFNTIRTWMPLTEDELLTAKEYGLMVLQGLWLDPIADPLRDNKFVILSPFIEKELRQYFERFSNYDNILSYLVGNEIPIDSIYRNGLVKTESMFEHVKKIAGETNSKCRVSFANWPQVLFLDNSAWDIVSYNVYPYYPEIISHSLGYYGFLLLVKDRFLDSKPLIITEYGLSVSQRGPGDFGYGGNTLEQQKEAIVSMYDDIIQSGANGGCLFEWNDEWWKNHEFNGDENSHNNEPEEWFGILGIEGDKDNYSEKLRPSYYAIKEYNQALIIKPKKLHFYKKSIPIRIYAQEDVYNIRFKIDDSRWKDLKKVSTHWWMAGVKANDKEIQPHTLKIQAVDKDNKILCEKKMDFWSGLGVNIKVPKYFVTIESKDIYTCGEKPQLINVLIKVVDENNNPVKDISVKYSFYETRLWEQVSSEKITNEEGLINIDYYIRESGFIIISVGVDCVYKSYKKRHGNIKFIEVISSL